MSHHRTDADAEVELSSVDGTAQLVMVNENGQQFGAIASKSADVTVTDRTEAVYRTAAAHQEDGQDTHALCATTELIGPVSRKALLLPAATDSRGNSMRAATTRDDGTWVRRVNQFLDTAMATGDYERWQEKALSSPSPGGHDIGIAQLEETSAASARATYTSTPRAARSSPVLTLGVVVGVVVVGLLLALRSPGGGEVICCCCAKRERSGGSYAGIPTTDSVPHHES